MAGRSWAGGVCQVMPFGTFKLWKGLLNPGEDEHGATLPVTTLSGNPVVDPELSQRIADMRVSTPHYNPKGIVRGTSPLLHHPGILFKILARVK